MFTHRSLFLFLTLASLLTTLAGTGEAGPNVELRVASLAPEGSPRLLLLRKSAGEVSTKSSGRVSLKYYASGAFGDDREVVRKMKLTQLDGGELSWPGLSLIEQSIRVLELPGLFATVQELDYVADKIWPHFQQKFATKGFVLAARGDVGPVQVMSNKEIRSVADFRATKICLLPGDGITQSLFKKLGVKGVSLAVPDVENALTTGGLDACYGSPPTALALNWDAKIKYVTSLSFGHAISATVIRQEPFNKMSADDQALVSKHLIATAAKQRSIVRGEATGARGKLQAAGVTFTQSPTEFTTEFDKAARAVETELTGKLFNKADLDLALKYRAEYRAKIAGK